MVGQVTEGIDLQLDVGGTIEGVLLDDWLGDPLVNQEVMFWDENGSRVGAFGEILTLETGDYRRQGLPAGTYFVTTSTQDAYSDELYDDFPCEPDCDRTTGTPVQLNLSQTISEIDFQLEQSFGIRGMVMGSAGPLVGVAIDVWDDTGFLKLSTATNVAGRYQVYVSLSDTYFVSTDNGQGLTDEIYDDVQCPEGPASQGLCDPLSGTPIEVDTGGPVVTGIDFLLQGLIFADGFESGDPSEWDVVVP